MISLLNLLSATLTSSTVTQIREYRRPAVLPPLTPELREVIVGCALGDLYIVKGKGYVNARLRFGQGYVHSAYLMHLYSLFKDYCITAPKVSSRTGNSPGPGHTNG
jgi:hypothetical protein